MEDTASWAGEAGKGQGMLRGGEMALWAGTTTPFALLGCFPVHPSAEGAPTFVGGYG